MPPCATTRPKPGPPKIRPPRFHVAWALLPGLFLGFLAGVQLAQDAPHRDTTALPGPEMRAMPAEDDVTRAEALNASRDGAERRSTDAPTGPTRRTEQARIDGMDPVAWLDRFGYVEARPVLR